MIRIFLARKTHQNNVNQSQPLLKTFIICVCLRLDEEIAKEKTFRTKWKIFKFKIFKNKQEQLSQNEIRRQNVQEVGVTLITKKF